MVDLMDLFTQMYEGNVIAWLAFSLIIAVVGLCTMLGIIWWKMPEPAKKLFLNNLWGHRPIVANAYDNRVLRFETPVIKREGLLYNKKTGFAFVPRLTKDADQFIGEAEREIMTKTFNIKGASGQFYLAYSGKGTVVNPELEAVLENSRFNGNPKDKKNPQDGYVYVDKNVLITTLQAMKDEFVKIKPVWITTFLDPRHIKEYLSKAYSKSQLLAQEIEIQDSVREQYQGNIIKMLVILNVVSVVGIFVMAAKLFGMF